MHCFGLGSFTILDLHMASAVDCVATPLPSDSESNIGIYNSDPNDANYESQREEEIDELPPDDNL